MCIDCFLAYMCVFLPVFTSVLTCDSLVMSVSACLCFYVRFFCFWVWHCMRPHVRVFICSLYVWVSLYKSILSGLVCRCMTACLYMQVFQCICFCVYIIYILILYWMHICVSFCFCVWVFVYSFMYACVYVLKVIVHFYIHTLDHSFLSCILSHEFYRL